MLQRSDLKSFSTHDAMIASSSFHASYTAALNSAERIECGVWNLPRSIRSHNEGNQSARFSKVSISYRSAMEIRAIMSVAAAKLIFFFEFIFGSHLCVKLLLSGKGTWGR